MGQPRRDSAGGHCAVLSEHHSDEQTQTASVSCNHEMGAQQTNSHHAPVTCSERHVFSEPDCGRAGVCTEVWAQGHSGPG